MDGSIERKNLKTEDLFDVEGLTGPVAEVIKKIKDRKIEVHNVTIGGTKYEYPAPEAVEDELLKIFSKTNEQDPVEERAQLFDFIDRFCTWLKDGKAALVEARRSVEVNKHDPKNIAALETSLAKARGAFYKARMILREQSEAAMPRLRRSDPHVPENVAQPSEILEMPKKDKPTLH